MSDETYRYQLWQQCDRQDVHVATIMTPDAPRIGDVLLVIASAEFLKEQQRSPSDPPRTIPGEYEVISGLRRMVPIGYSESIVRKVRVRLVGSIDMPSTQRRLVDTMIRWEKATSPPQW